LQLELLIKNEMLKGPFFCELSSAKSLQLFNEEIIEHSTHATRDFNVVLKNITNLKQKYSQDFLTNLFGFNIFIPSNLYTDNLNNMNNYKLFIDGILEGDVANNLGKKSTENILVLRELDVKMINGTGLSNTTLVLLGKKDGVNSIFDFGNDNKNDNGKFKLQETSKLCIDINKFTPDSKIKLEQIEGGGEVVIYSDTNYKYINNNVKFTPKNNYKEFLNYCEISNYVVPMEVIDIPEILEELPTSEIIDVIYH